GVAHRNAQQIRRPTAELDRHDHLSPRHPDGDTAGDHRQLTPLRYHPQDAYDDVIDGVDPLPDPTDGLVLAGVDASFTPVCVSTARCDSWMRRSVLTNVPVFSAKLEPGRTTSA